jgi:sugar lactone lactonase YvrE
MRRTHILVWTLLAVFLGGGSAWAAPADPYVVYAANSRVDGAVILRVDPATGALAEISRNGAQGTLFRKPYDLAVEPDGSLVVADLGEPCNTGVNPPCPNDGRVIRVDPLTGRQSLVSSGGVLVDTAGIAVAANGTIYVVDNLAADGDGGVIRIDPRTGAQTVIARGPGTLLEPDLDLPFGILVDRDGTLVVSNRETPGDCTLLPPGGSLIRIDPATGARSRIADRSLFALFDRPLGLVLDSAGRIVFANECGGTALVRVTLSVLQPILEPLTGKTVLVTPERIALAPNGNLLVSDFALAAGEGGIVSVTPSGAQSLFAGGALFNAPLGIAAVVNRPPVAALSAAPGVVAAGRPVRLDGSGSRDPDGQRLVYEWDLNGDGAFEGVSGTNPTASHTFTLDGTATVHVRVNDPHGGRALAGTRVTVDGSMPMVTGVRLGARVLGVGRRGRPRAARRPPPRSTKLRFRLSEPATAVVTLERARAGRRDARGRCRPGRRRGRRCLSWSRARRITRAMETGSNAITVRSRGLKPGRFRVALEASDRVGNRSARRTVTFRVVRLRD